MKTYHDIIQQLVDTNDMLIADKISIDKAKQVAQNTQVLINAAKLQLEICKQLKLDTPAFLSVQSIIEPIDKTLKEIEDKKKKPITFDE